GVPLRARLRGRVHRAAVPPRRARGRRLLPAARPRPRAGDGRADAGEGPARGGGVSGRPAPSPGAHGPPVLLLLRLDARRLADSLRRPSGSWIGVGLPLLLLAGFLWVVGGAAVPRVDGAGGAMTLGLLVAGPLAFAGYGTLFGGSDSAFLRRLGIPARALYHERALRLLLRALGWAGPVLPPFLSAGVPRARPVAVVLAGSLAAGGVGTAALTAAALAVSVRRPEQGWGCLAMGMWDMELAAIAPLVHA